MLLLSQCVGGKSRISNEEECKKGIQKEEGRELRERKEGGKWKERREGLVDCQRGEK